MKGKIFLFLFALPFFGVGAWMLYAIGSDGYDAWQMRIWTATPATLDNAGYSSHAGDDSTTYEAYARYSYVFSGQRYEGSRVGLSGGADNIGSYQQDTGRRLSAAWRSGQPITVYVNPERPADSVIDRDIRWSMIGFRSIFVLVFGGFGLGMIVFLFRARPDKDTDDPRYADSPWLANDDWQDATIRSSSKSAMYVAWGFAAFWNLISAPLPFAIYDEVVDKQNLVALVGLLFPVIGIGLVAWAIGRTREWLRFGPTPVTLDPFPGSIGGHVGGRISLRMPYAAGINVEVTLSNLRSYISGSGKNRSRREKALWQDRQVAQLEPGPEGTTLTFRFSVPPDAVESDAVRGNDSYHLWRLSVAAELPGADLSRDFEIPVYATAVASSAISDRVFEGTDDAHDLLAEQAAKERFRTDIGVSGQQLLYPMGRNVLSALGGIVIGGIFLASGVYLGITEGERLFGGVFAFVGGLIALFSIYMVSNSLQVRKEAGALVSTRRLFGIPIGTQSLRADQVARFSKRSTMQTQSGRKHVMHYSLYAHDAAGNKVCIGEGFTGEAGGQCRHSNDRARAVNPSARRLR